MPARQRHKAIIYFPYEEIQGMMSSYDNFRAPLFPNTDFISVTTISRENVRLFLIDLQKPYRNLNASITWMSAGTSGVEALDPKLSRTCEIFAQFKSDCNRLKQLSKILPRRSGYYFRAHETKF